MPDDNIASMKACLLFAAAIAGMVLGSSPSHAETVKDRAGAVREDRAKMESNDQWIYNDWRKGFDEAKNSGKPLLVVLRCVPCLACMGIDAGVLTEESLRPLLSKFVRVRVINANALDLSLFQFDYDLSFSAMFFNGDGTVYGRFGSWAHQKNSLDKDTAGFRQALEGALRIHDEYPANKSQLAGKQGAAMPVKDPLQLPELAGKYSRELDWDGKVVQSCVHCHQIGDAMRSAHRGRKEPIPPKWIYPMPPPESIGLTLAAASPRNVESVELNSIAARAGLQAGDEIMALDRQPILSVADASWALHHAPESGNVTVAFRRNGQDREAPLSLSAGWRARSDISRRVGTWPMRAMALGGLKLADLSPPERAARGLSESKMALLVEHAGEYGEHAAAKKAGVQKGDVLLEVDGLSTRMTEGELIGRLLEKRQPDASIKAILLRGTERVPVTWPAQ